MVHSLQQLVHLFASSERNPDRSEPFPSPMSAASPAAAPSLLRRLKDLDTALSLRIHTACQPVPRFLLKSLEVSGDGRLWFPAIAAILPFSSPRDPLFSGVLAGLLLDLIFVGLLKHLIRRPRPVYNKGMSLVVAVDHWSFPSGHSSRVFFIASFLYLSAASLSLYVGSNSWIRHWYDGEGAEILILVVFLWSAATSASRVLLGRHFVFDVVAGTFLGVFEALIVVYFLKPLLEFV